MEDLEPVITEEEWNEFVQEFNLEIKDDPEKQITTATTQDVDDFFFRLGNW